MIDTRKLLKASSFAEEAHEGITRGGSGRSYYESHLVEVGYLTLKCGGTEDSVIAAILHDVVEDTDVTLKEVRRNFGKTVNRMVDELTDSEEILHLPLLERKKMQAIKVKPLLLQTKLVKLADQASNVYALFEDPPLNWSGEKIREYAEGAKLVAEACNDRSFPWLWTQFVIYHSKLNHKYAA